MWFAGLLPYLSGVQFTPAISRPSCCQTLKPPAMDFTLAKPISSNVDAANRPRQFGLLLAAYWRDIGKALVLDWSIIEPALE